VNGAACSLRIKNFTGSWRGERVVERADDRTTERPDDRKTERPNDRVPNGADRARSRISDDRLVVSSHPNNKKTSSSMHGRPRKAKPSAQETEADRVARVEAKAKKAKKAELFSQLCARVLGARASGSYDPALLKMSEKLVEMNPEMYTVWNYRRAYLDPVLAGGGDGAVDAAGRELEVTARALMQNPKSYSTFHHRRWVVSQGFCSLEKEVALVEGLLDVDARNFHGWGYRRWVVGVMGMERGRELAYSRRKIEENFSNYSAWHHRSVVFGRFGLGWEEAGAELGFVRQACYTDPRWVFVCLLIE